MKGRLLLILGVALTLISAYSAPVHAETTSLAKLFALGQNVTCTYQTTDTDGTQNGTIYVAQNRMRGDIQVTTAEGVYLMHMLREGQWQYMWGGPMGEAQGMKINTATADSGNGQRQGPDFNEDMNLDCRPWSADASMLEPPTDIQFHELGQMGAPVTGMSGSYPDMRSMQCSACEQAPDESSRAQCLQALGC